MGSAEDMAVLIQSQSRWEIFEYFLSGLVALGCLGEFTHECTSWFKSQPVWEKSGGAASAILLVGALAIEIPTQFKVNSISGQTIDFLKSQTADAMEHAARLEKQTSDMREQAAITEERLLGERRLTARERWRLERVERAVLPRSLYVNWPMLANSLKVGKFQPINVALIGSSMEASGFAMNLGLALQSAGVLGQYFDLSSASAESLTLNSVATS